jgi:hypothetical protein
MAPQSAWIVRSGSALFLQFFYPVLLIIDNCCRKRVSAWHAEVRQRHDECLAFFLGNDVAHDPTLVAGVRQIGDQLTGWVCDGEIFRLKMLDRGRQHFDFERNRRLKCS